MPFRVTEIIGNHPADLTGTSRIPGAMIILIYTLAFVALLSPLWWIEVPVLIDYPNHLARIWLLSGQGPSGSYVVDWKLLPNLAFELVGTGLALFIPFQIVNKIFVGACIILPVLGVIAIRRAILGYVGSVPLFGCLFVYNYAFYWGFVNYLFTLGCALNFFAFYCIRPIRIPWLGIAVNSAIASILIVFHLFAFAIYVLLVIGYEADRMTFRERRIDFGRSLRSCLEFGPSILIWMMSVRNGESVETFYGNFANKMVAAVSTMLFGDGGAIAFCAVAAIAFFSFLGREWVIHHDLRTTIIALFALSLVMPFSMMGSRFADVRLPIALSFLLVAGTMVRSTGRRNCLIFAALASCWMGVRIWSVTESWILLNQEYQEFRSAIRELPPGSRLIFVRSEMPPDRARIGAVPEWLMRREELEYIHLPALAVIDSGAVVPGALFTLWSPVAERPDQASPVVPSASTRWYLQLQDLARCDSVSTSAGTTSCRAASSADGFPAEWPSHFDFVISIDFGVVPETALLPLRPVRQGSFFHVYRILP